MTLTNMIFKTVNRQQSLTVHRCASKPNTACSILLLSLLSLTACSDSSDDTGSNQSTINQTDNTVQSGGAVDGVTDANDTAQNNAQNDQQNVGETQNSADGSNGSDADGSDADGSSTNSNAQTDGADVGDTNAGNAVNSDTSQLGETEPVVLTPLPQPPLTAAPAAIDEPIGISGPVSTVTEYFVVRDPGPKLPKDTTGDFTDADFNAGPLPDVVTTPANVDPTINRAPYFDNLTNQTVFAGSELNLLLRPVDPDGNIPGMFPEALPEGAQLIDNFNGTKTLRWRPLQPDVGILSFTITAVDHDEPAYRTRSTILIKVVMPSDPSTIINLAPVVNTVRDHTVQVNDPVVIEIKGSDANGTIPTLEVFNQPPGATLVPHPIEPDFVVLRFIPRTTGLITLTVVATDAINPDSTGSTTINIDVRPASDFVREGSTLRALATARGLRLGYASVKDFYYRPDGALYARTAANEFNFVSPENSLKWSVLNPLPGRYRWASADNLVNFARVKGMEVHGHTLIWHRQLPKWITFSAVDTRETHMREYIDRVLNRYSDRVPVWDVVNESFEDNGEYRNSVWFEAMGERYIEIAFRQAKQSAPDARLLYNEYDVSWFGPKADAMFRMLQKQKDLGTPIDGVGFQMHIFSAFDKFDEVEANFQKAAELDLDIYITELDVSIADGGSLEQQADVYRRVLDICLRQPRCKGLQTWGFTDQYSWRRQYNPLLLDESYQVKPAYTALQQRLSEN